MENRLHASYSGGTGQGAPRPHHVVVNGWYFYSINWLSLECLAPERTLARCGTSFANPDGSPR